MKNRSQRRVPLWISRVLLIGLGLVLCGPALAQDNRPIPKSYLNKGTVHLPIQIDDRARPQIQEVQLYVKEGPQAPWNLKDKVPGTQPYFTFRTTQEGEYWFNVVTVDRAGRAMPADITKEPPGLIVIIDSTPPQTDVQLLNATPEGQLVRCVIRDANPDPSKTRFFYQTRDQLWRGLEAVPGQPDTFCIPVQAATTGMIRVVAGDMAGNTATGEFNVAGLSALANAAPPAPKAPPIAPILENTPDRVVMAPPPPPEPMATAPPAPAPKGPVVISEKIIPVSERIDVVANKQGPAPLPPIPPVEPAPAPKVPFAAAGGPDIRPAADSKTVDSKTVDSKTADSKATDRTVDAKSSMPVQQVAAADLPAKRAIVNSTHCFLDYQVEQTGASGVGKVEIWYTRDLGRVWHKLGEDANRKGQAEVTLPGEGLYGVTMVVANGRGFGAIPPKNGDTPDWWIEVDTTKPQAELLNVRSNPDGEDGSLHIIWTAKDKNLGPDPIDLFYAGSRQGPWLPIAKGLKNDGLYRWTPPQDAGSHAFVRLTVHDQAGNTTSSESIQSVALDDLSRPRGRLVGITTAPRGALTGNPMPTPPSGN